MAFDCRGVYVTPGCQLWMPGVFNVVRCLTRGLLANHTL